VYARFLEYPILAPQLRIPKPLEAATFRHLLTWQHLPTPTRAGETKPAVAHPQPPATLPLSS
jgi:hypothetical protein